ncbi:MAG: helix-turn-helix domain-containing protein [Thermoplasmata archaeon]
MELDSVCVIREGAREYCIYPLDRLMTVLGKKWTLFVIAVLGNIERMRFNEIHSELRFVSSRTLTDRLKELETLGLVRREAFAEIPPRVEYRLTQRGQEMRRVLIPLLSWAMDFETSGAQR